MTYPYASRNLFAEPEHYMYAPFQGTALLDAYFEQRSRTLIQSAGGVGAAAEHDGDWLWTRGARRIAERLDLRTPEWPSADAAAPVGEAAALSLDCVVVTEQLLRMLIAQQLAGEDRAESKVWLDRLVQRFEVTKKLYQEYEAGFRKGRGPFTAVRPYGFFALALALQYTLGGGLKYLNTWLKVADLLSSLDPECLQRAVPPVALRILLAAEIVCVRTLAERRAGCRAIC